MQGIDNVMHIELQSSENWTKLRQNGFMVFDMLIEFSCHMRVQDLVVQRLP